MGTKEMLLAKIADDLDMLLWSKTEDALTGSNKPKSVLSKLLNIDEEDTESDLETFQSGIDFENTKERILRRNLYG